MAGRHTQDLGLETSANGISRRQMLRRAAILGLTASEIASLLASYDNGNPTLAATDGITVVHGSEPRSMNPPLDNVKTTLNIQLTVFDPLVGVSSNLRIRPSLATDWKQVKETVWRFHLRRGIKFHNGED